MYSFQRTICSTPDLSQNRVIAAGENRSTTAFRIRIERFRCPRPFAHETAAIFIGTEANGSTGGRSKRPHEPKTVVPARMNPATWLHSKVSGSPGPCTEFQESFRSRHR